MKLKEKGKRSWILSNLHFEIPLCSFAAYLCYASLLHWLKLHVFAYLRSLFNVLLSCFRECGNEDKRKRKMKLNLNLLCSASLLLRLKLYTFVALLYFLTCVLFCDRIIWSTGARVFKRFTLRSDIVKVRVLRFLDLNLKWVCLTSLYYYLCLWIWDSLTLLHSSYISRKSVNLVSSIKFVNHFLKFPSKRVLMEVV